MSAGKLALVLTLLGSIAAVLYITRSSREPNTIFEPDIRPVEAGTPCPWRDADMDLTNWFPGATKYEVRDFVLSAKRLQLQKRLGRSVRPDEMALHCYPVLSNDIQIGLVLTRRLKGEHGAIEVALALVPDHKIHRLKIQRIREPAEIVDALEKCDLEQQLDNKSVKDDVIFVCPNAQGVAGDLAKEVKALLILYELGYSELSHSHH